MFRSRTVLAIAGLLLVCIVAAVLWLTHRSPPSSAPTQRAGGEPERHVAPPQPPPPVAVEEPERKAEGDRRAATRAPSVERAPKATSRGKGSAPPATPVMPEPTPEISVGTAGAVPPPLVPEPLTRRPVEPVSALPSGVAGPAAETSRESAALARVIGRYQSAYGTRDASGVAAVWPTVDMRALSRAFDRLQNQELQLNDCTYAVSLMTATGYCTGVLRYARKIGDTSPKVERHTWMIEFAKSEGTWRIVRVSAE